MGLPPGEYVARVDSVQMEIMGLTAVPPQREFTIKILKEGDIAGGIDFVLDEKRNESIPKN
jgi:hypothetical protein